MNSSSVRFLVLTSLFVLIIFGVFYPSHFLIADELSYFEQALNWSGNQHELVQCPPCTGPCQTTPPANYPAGTGLLAALFISVAGPKSVFWMNILLWLAGIWAIALNLFQQHKSLAWAAYPALFLPGLVLCRTLMSDMSGFALAAIFIWLFCAGRQSRILFFLAGCAAGLALLFRETNVLWSLPFLIGAMWRRETMWRWLWTGFAFGGLARLGAAWWLFADPFFVKDPGIGFSWTLLPGNLVFYVVVLSLLCPAGLWLWWKSRHPFRTEIGVGIALFLLVYSAYGYDAFDKSGYKGWVLQGRFMLPLLPFLTLSAASAGLVFFNKIKTTLVIAAGVFFLGVQIGGWRYNLEQQKFTQALQALPTNTHISFTPDESRKYLNALQGPVNLMDGANLRAGSLNCRPRWYVHTISRSESPDRKNKAEAAKHAVQHYFKNWKMQAVTDIRIFDGARLQVWQVQQFNNNE